MKKLLALLCALALVLSLAACGGIPDAPAEPDPGDSASGMRIVFGDPLKKETEYTADDGTVLLLETYELPQLEVRTADNEVYTPADVINNVLPQEYKAALAFNAEMQRAAETLDASAQEELEMARGLYASLDAEQRSYWSNYVEELIVDSICQHSGLVSVWGVGYAYYGGAHGWESIRAWNFDLTAGEFLTLDGLNEQPSADSALGETLSHTLAMSVLAQIDEQGLSENYFEDYASYIFDLPANASFFFDDQGMAISFDPAVIAPYAASAQKFYIPYRDFYNALDSHTQSLLDVPEEERVLADYNTTKILWSWFNMTTPPVDSGAPGVTVDGLSLSRVTLDGVNTLDALRALLCEHVSGALADEWLATGRFVERNGALYAAWADRGSDDTIAGDGFQVSFDGEGGVLTQTVMRRDWDDAADDWALTGEIDTYEYPFVLAGGHAVFTAFPCPE